MNKKLLVMMLAVVMLFSILLTACASEKPAETKPAETTETAVETQVESEVVEGESEQRVIVWNIGQEPKTWDPAQNSMSSGSSVITQLYEGLTYAAVDGIQPGVAKNWETSEDGLVWTFHLREDAKWSDGKPVTAHDFVYSIKRICDPNEASPNVKRVADYIKGAQEFYDGTGTRDEMMVTALDDYTLEIVLKNATPYFDELASTNIYNPTREDIVTTGEGWEKRAETAITNGPYKVSEYLIGSHILFEKNENYWDSGNVNIQKIKGVFITDPNTALQASQAGDMDVNSQIPSEEIQKLMAEEPYIHVVPRSGVWFLAFNCDVEPMDNVLVRKAISLAIDRKSIVENVTKAGEIPATGFINPVPLMSDGNPYRPLEEDGYPKAQYGIEPRAANVEEAQKILADAGYPNGEGFPEIVMKYNTSDANKKVMEAIQQMLNENLNIVTTLENMESNAYFDGINLGEFVLGRVGWFSSSFNVNGSFEFFTSQSGDNQSQWRWKPYAPASWDTKLNPDNELFDTLYDESMTLVGKERDEKVLEAEAALMDSVPGTPIFYYTTTYFINEDHIEDLKTSPEMSFIFKEAKVVE